MNRIKRIPHLASTSRASIVFGLGALVGLVGCRSTMAASVDAGLSPAEDVVHRYHGDVWDQGRLDHIGQYIGAGFVDHNQTISTLPPGQHPGADFLAQFRIGFPDLHSHEDYLFADGDRVTLGWTITGTHTGPFFGVAPTGRPIQVSGLDVIRVADGKFVEHWGGIGDQMDDFFAQIGMPGADLDGTWSTACFNRSRTQLVYAHLQLTGTFTAYADDACATPTAESHWTGAATIAGPIPAIGATKLDLAFATYTSTPLDAGTAAYFNQTSYCGHTDWVAAQARSVLGASCAGFSIPVGGKSLDIYKVDANTLTFGTGAAISVAPPEADRPTALDPSRAFTRP